MTQQLPPAQDPGGEIALFANDEFQLEIAPHGVDGFRVQAPGLSKALGFHSAADMLRSLPEDEKGSGLVQTLGGPQRVGYVTEAGFYRVVGQRQAARITNLEVRDAVARFQKWVFGEVLPSLRRRELAPASAAPVVAAPRNELEVLRAVVDEMIATRAAAERATAAALDASQEAKVANARIDAIEGNHDYFAGLGWARLAGWTRTDDVTLARLGRIAGTIGRAHGLTPGKAPHAHYGEVNTWPRHVWDEAARRFGGAA